MHKRSLFSLLVVLFCTIARADDWELLPNSEGTAIYQISPIDEGKNGFLVITDSGLQYMSPTGELGETFFEGEITALTKVTNYHDERCPQCYVAYKNTIYAGDRTSSSAPYILFRKVAQFNKPHQLTCYSNGFYVFNDSIAVHYPMNDEGIFSEERSIQFPESVKGMTLLQMHCTFHYSTVFCGTFPKETEAKTSIGFISFREDKIEAKYSIPNSYCLNTVHVGGVMTPALFIGSDSTLHLRGSNTLDIETPHKLRVNSICSAIWSFGDNKFDDGGLIATDSGVYYLDTYSEEPQFVPVGSPIRNTTDLISYEKSKYIYAATKNGVYAYKITDTPITPLHPMNSKQKKVSQTTEKVTLFSPAFTKDDARISIIALSGRVISQVHKKPHDNQITLTVSELQLASGKYIIQVDQASITSSFSVTIE